MIGSTTAVTLVPALADSGAKHVTMLQRSPHLSLIAARPGQHRPKLQPLAAGDHGLHRGTVEERAAPGGRGWRLQKAAHAEGVPGLIQRQLRGYDVQHFGLQPLGPAIVLGAQRHCSGPISSREGARW